MDVRQMQQQQRLTELFSGARRGSWRSKRRFDLILSIFAIILLSPLLIAISLAIVIDDPHGGPIFKQTRVGRHGKEFTLYKFRSMVVNAEALLASIQSENESDGPAFKIKEDPRITKIGKFIRRTSIDELPQLFNILKGDMSFVGPRPPLPREVAQYNEYHMLRLMVTPGLTCYWQMHPGRNDVSFEDWMDMDIDYIIHRSTWTDIKILFGTALSIVKDPGR